ncbi:MAG TPA: FtsX-like permease family protein [Thermoanaerobaculia bacterium]|jgi:ABC-type antimicrobial peptide transport system permease subunit
MLVRLVLASLRRRFRQLGLILAAVTVAAATVATLAGFSSRAEHRLGESLAAFGPNLTVRPQVGGPALLPASAVARLRAVPGVRSAALAAGSDRVEVRADPDRLEGVARAIEARIEGVEAVPLRRVSQSDARLTRRLTLVLVAVSAVSFLLALLSVGAATTALVGERRTEIGLLLALGFTGRRVGGFLAAELLAAAVLAGAVGEILGELAAGGLARRVLGAGGGGAMTWGGFAAAALVAVLVVGSSMAVALRRVERLDAARVLRGD